MDTETQINTRIFETFPVLESERLLFRAYKKEDAKILFNIRSHKAVSKYMYSIIPKDITDTEQRIEGYINAFQDKTGMIWVIEEKTSNKQIGDLGIWRINHQNSRGEIGYALHPNSWGKGYMTEALNTIIRFGFDNINIHSYEANVNTENINSKRLLLKFGFKLEAQFRENFYYDGQFLDSEIYCLLKSDIS